MRGRHFPLGAARHRAADRVVATTAPAHPAADITGLQVHPVAAATIHQQLHRAAVDTIMPPAAAGITTLRPVLQVVAGIGRPAALPAAITHTERVLPLCNDQRPSYLHR